jgi:hypothetical protein
MKTILNILQVLSLAAATIPGQVDSVCREYCQVLAVQGGVVKYIDQTPPAPRAFDVGSYLAGDQTILPRTEAPIRDLRSQRGWRIIASAFLRHDGDNEGEPAVRIRFYDSHGSEPLTDDVLESLQRFSVGRPFGGEDEIFVVTSGEEHSYNVETELWYLPENGKPKRLVWLRGVFEAFARAGQVPGVSVGRQTYDGEHAETKGVVREFYIWDPRAKSLTLRTK